MDRVRDQGYRGVFLKPVTDRPYGFVTPLLDLVFDSVDGTPLMARRLLKDDGPLLLRLDSRLGAIENYPVEALPPLPPQAERMRVRGALWRVLRRLARQEPVAVMVDGLAAADELSSELLGYLVEQTEADDDVPLAFVVSGAIDDDLRTFARLQLLLEPLDGDAVNGLAREILGGPVSEALGRQANSQRSPLFVRELIRRWSDLRLWIETISGVVSAPMMTDPRRSRQRSIGSGLPRTTFRGFQKSSGSYSSWWGFWLRTVLGSCFVEWPVRAKQKCNN